MNNVILISCVSKKLSRMSKAKDLYVSTLFKLNLKYSRGFETEDVYILSAKYGLLDLETEVQPYDVTLNNMSSGEVKIWSSKVLSQLQAKYDLQKVHFIFLAGEKYRKYLIPHLASYDIPMKGLRIGEQLKYLKEKTR